MQIITVTISPSGTVVLSSNQIGHTGESEAAQLTFVFPSNIEGYTKTLEIRNGISTSIAPLPTDTYVIPSSILPTAGLVAFQVTATSGSVIWKSDIFRLWVQESINTDLACPACASAIATLENQVAHLAEEFISVWEAVQELIDNSPSGGGSSDE